MNMDASNGWAFDERPFAAVGGYGRTRPLFGGEKALDQLIAGFDAAMFGQAVGEPEGSRAGGGRLAGSRNPTMRNQGRRGNGARTSRVGPSGADGLGAGKHPFDRHEGSSELNAGTRRADTCPPGAGEGGRGLACRHSGARAL